MKSPPNNSRDLANQPFSFKLVPPSSSSGICKSELILSCNFDLLAEQYPEFRDAWSQALLQGQKSRTETTFNSTAFNRALTRSLLDQHFHLLLPSLPEGRLCPPIPNRANYVLWLRELIASCANDLERFSSRWPEGGDGEDQMQQIHQLETETKSGWHFQGIDIGTGVSAIYPLLLSTSLFAKSDALTDKEGDGKITDSGPNTKMPNAQCNYRNLENTWKFLATDIDPVAVESARTNVEANHLDNQIFVVQVDSNSNTNDSDLRIDEKSRTDTHKGPLFGAMTKARSSSMFHTSKPSSADKTYTATKAFDLYDLSMYPKFDFVMTNPPFYSTLDEASTPRAGDKRSRTEMTSNEAVYCHSHNDDFNNDIGSTVSCRDNTNGQRGPLDEGGDLGFIMAILRDSQFFRHHVTWYTSLVAKRSSLEVVLRRLQTLDGIWGNRGQIRTVEFRQGNSGYDSDHDGNNRKGEPIRCSPRVRWGIGWTYVRAAARCSACRITSGLTSFNVSMSSKARIADREVNANDHEKNGRGQISSRETSCEHFTEACSDEMVSRLMVYFNSFREPSLKCIHRTRNGSPCVTAIEKRFANRASLYPTFHKLDEDNANLPVAGHFIIDAFVRVAKSSNHTRSDQTGIEIEVLIEAYSHTKRGSILVDKIRGSMPGEIKRTNRRWRRLEKTGNAR
ncbi:hypothetical protein HJC23_006470 [Cyclotella cryptica]|uniref:Methyltransferase small domain-containing protein n=1 Tax=Cyclotella cryptica TaxID=29204 RepID=A0ABD3QV70_9STRA|eukprot:CCRYP_001907-RA/>CCRYP_001907-RA protein AED:0.26 eAED:-0.11 QI:0/-1/0/1/-1/1/1/0/677